MQQCYQMDACVCVVSINICICVNQVSTALFTIIIIIMYDTYRGRTHAFVKVKALLLFNAQYRYRIAGIYYESFNFAKFANWRH